MKIWKSLKSERVNCQSVVSIVVTKTAPLLNVQNQKTRKQLANVRKNLWPQLANGANNVVWVLSFILDAKNKIKKVHCKVDNAEPASTLFLSSKTYSAAHMSARQRALYIISVY